MKNFFYIVLLTVVFLSQGMGGTLPDVGEVRLNLVLRNIGHEIYKAQQDTTSKLEPIQVLGSHRYMINVGVKVDYNNLIQIIDSIFTNHGIRERYDVALLDCETNDVLLGFTHEALVKDNVACRSRNAGEECHNILINFRPEKPANYTGLYVLFGLVLLLLGWYVFRMKPMEVSLQPIWDESAQKLSFADKQVEFTHREAQIFSLLFESNGDVVTREAIEQAGWQSEGLFKSRTVDVTMSKIRKKINIVPNWEIQAVHGIGYKLVDVIQA